MFRFFACLILIISFNIKALDEQPKNIVIILADDLGWNDTTIFQPSQFLETPNINALAAKGMIFSQAYANSPLCSPTRASLLTGQTPARHGSTTPSHHLPLVRLTPSLPASAATNRKSIAPQTVTRLDTKLPTLSSIAKANGYHTAHFGKWHLGARPYSPLEHGFDIDIPNFHGAGPTGGYLAPWSFAPDIQPQTAGEHIDIRLAKEAKKWIFSVKDDGPFFLNFWAFSVHAPFNADADVIDYFINKRSGFHSQRNVTYAAMVKQFDDAIGILWQALVEAKVEKNTIIIFTSDNGGNMYTVVGNTHATSNFPLKGGKATEYEGGLRVPTAVIWPGLTQPNTLSDTPIQTADFFPTLLNGVNLSWPSTHIVDGRDIRPILQGDTLDTRAIFTYYPAEPKVPDWLPPSATVTLDGWKLIRTFHYGKYGGHLYKLYNLDLDPSESVNLAETQVHKVTELDALLEAYLLESEAVTPIVNANYRDGAFNYDTIGVEKENYRLPEQKIPSDIQFQIKTDQQVIDGGDTARFTYILSHHSNTASVLYKQFMGPTVTLTADENSISFVAPEVTQEEYVGLAFIVRDQGQTIRKQVGVRINPTQVAPSLTVSQVTQNITKGSTASFNIEAIDLNKDFIHMSVSSDNLLANSLSLPPTVGEFKVSIPTDYSDTSVTLMFTADDRHHQASQTVTFNVAPKPSAVNNETTSKSAGSVHFVMLFSVLFIILLRRRID
ncbi:sulfatase [Paraglaciecola sp. 20A4]|uniref:sulfatase n=1 Tax=Paraglaciecola sp. 20A4 TaxID=2687288 RepID=UPI0014076660|nr:sulfatase [Paraglaciecola sp. 20A4]